ncbi:MAG: MFS transporter, partial [Xanthomonadales bacterium]|nr:MFS transporter [Xanthomonadales bacterium]
WFLWFMQNENFFGDMVEGAAGLAIVIGILPAILLRERFKEVAVQELEAHEPHLRSRAEAIRTGVSEFFTGFANTLKVQPFRKLCLATFLVFNGFIMIAAFGFYVIIYYVFSGDTVTGAKFAGYAGSLGAVSTFIVIIIVSWMATRIGKKRAFYVSTGLSMLGYALKWVCYNPEYPWLILVPAPLMAFGLGGLFTLMPSMIADVVDLDEISTHERREGMFGSIFWWVVKLGQAVAIAAGGFMLNATGFDVALEGNQTEHAIFMMRVFDAFVPFIASGIAIWAIATYSLTEERAHEIRRELEARRGKV